MITNAIGVDVSKDGLDAYSLSGAAHAKFDNNRVGFRAFSNWARKQDVELIVYEPTGFYHRNFERAMLAEAMPLTKVNPLYARRFAEATGHLAKTDKIDATMLARMGVAVDHRRVEATEEDILVLKELSLARRNLARDLVIEKNRLEAVTISRLKVLCRRRIRQIESQMKEVEKEITKTSKAKASIKRRMEIITSIPGINYVAGASILSEMPELGTMTGKTTASLAGLAPMNRESGYWKGKARIRGGRRELRKAMFMPAVVAVRLIPAMKKRFHELKDKGKPGKVALVAVMRKILLMINALIRDDREWTPHSPA